jgi:hypothetical protein
VAITRSQDLWVSRLAADPGWRSVGATTEPDLYWENFLEVAPASNMGGYGVAVNIYPDGSVWRSQMLSLTLACPVSLTNMPYDTQSCEWWTGIYSDHAHEVRLRWRAGRTALQGYELRDSCPSGWTPTGQDQENLVQVWPSGNYSYAWAEIEFTRNDTVGWIESYFTTSIILVFLAYLGTWINPLATPARVTLGVVTILSVQTNKNALIRELPFGHASKVWLMRFVNMSFQFNVGIFIEQFVVGFAVRVHSQALIKDQREAPSAGGSAKYTSAAAAATSATAAEDDDEEFEAQISAAELAVAELEVESTLPASPRSAREPTGSAERSRKALRVAARKGAIAVKRAAARQRNPMDTAGIVNAAQENRGARYFLASAAMLRELDVYARFIIPVVYIIHVYMFLHEVNFGRDHYDLLAANTQCDEAN